MAYIRKAAGALYLLALLILLVGCQGMSTGGASSSSSAASGTLAVTPNTLAVGSVAAGSSATAIGNLTASGANVKLTNVSSNNSVFSVGGLSLPVTISAGHSVPFTVTFTPQVAGGVTAKLTFSGTSISTGQTFTTTETLTGSGMSTTHTVSLSWDASTSADISGYYVYRASYANSCGSFSRINSLLVTSTLYSDFEITDGNSYCYATTAVNSIGEESTFSNIVSNIQVPAP